MANDGIFPGLTLRQPPSNIQAERAILGALLSRNRLLDQCVDLTPEHFHDPDLGSIYERIVERLGSGKPVSGVSLRGEFGDQVMAELLASDLGTPSIREYVEDIIKCANLRALIEIGENLVTQSFHQVDPTDLATDCVSRIDGIAVGSSLNGGVTLDDAICEAEQAIEQARGRNGPSGISTGFQCVDNRIGGLEPGTLTVIAARPGMGKSALALGWAVHAARSGVGVLMVSLEMSAIELGRRVLATYARVPITAMKYGNVDTEGWSRIVLAKRQLAGIPLRIVDSAGLKANQIAAQARSMKRKGLGLVVVDHLHIVRPDEADTKQGATWAVGRISGAMKRLAKDCGVPVLLLAQLNRGVEGRDDKRPALGDLRQSGDIEQDADAVGFVYRPEYYMGNAPEQKPGETQAVFDSRARTWHENREKMAGKAEIIWAKIRDGGTGTDHLMFNAATTTFSEPDQEGVD